MSTRKLQLKWLALFGFAVLAAGCTWAWAQRQESTSLSPEQQQARQVRLDAMRQQGAAASVVIYPVAMPDVDQTSNDIRDVVGLLLEQGGMTGLAPADAAYKPGGDLDLEADAAAFAEFLRRQAARDQGGSVLRQGVQPKPLDGGGEYALYVSIGGTYESGPDEVRGVVVTAAGEVVWAEQLDSADREFRDLKPKEPMTCCNLITAHLLDALDVSRPKQPAADGYFAQLWQKKSGTPDQAGRDAMDDRLADLKAKDGRASLIIFPVQIPGTGADRAAAETLKGLITEAGLFSSVEVDGEVVFDLQASSNEQRRLWDLAKAVSTHLQANPVEADYALFAEYLMNPEKTKVGAVHFVLCNAKGEWVIVDYQNNHHPAFQSVDPKSVEDCSKLVLRQLTGHLE